LFDSSSDPEKPRENFFKICGVSPLFYAENRKNFFRSNENFFRNCVDAKKKGRTAQNPRKEANATLRRRRSRRFFGLDAEEKIDYLSAE